MELSYIFVVDDKGKPQSQTVADSQCSMVSVVIRGHKVTGS